MKQKTLYCLVIAFFCSGCLSISVVLSQKIIVTGGAGFIGSHVAKKLLERGDTVIIIDSLNDYYNPELKQSNLKRLKKLMQAQSTAGFRSK